MTSESPQIHCLCNREDATKPGKVVLRTKLGNCAQCLTECVPQNQGHPQPHLKRPHCSREDHRPIQSYIYVH